MTDFLLKAEKWLDHLDGSSLEEKATYAEFLIKFSDRVVTQSLNPFTKKSETIARLPLYYLAEWLVYYWWRICYEPATEKEQKESFSWKMAHKMAAVNHGNVWPDMTFLSDGRTMNLFAKETYSKIQDTGFAYLNNASAHLSLKDFEAIAFRFLEEVEGRLCSKNIRETNFQDLLTELRKERKSEEISKWRQMEARLGYNPDEGDEEKIIKLLKEAERFGGGAIEETIAGTDKPIEFLNEVKELAKNSGDFFEIEDLNLKKEVSNLYKDWNSKNFAPWKLGKEVAREARKTLAVALDQPLEDSKILEFLSLPTQTLEKTGGNVDLPFLLEEQGTKRLVLRVKSPNGRRFELCRFLGNDLLPFQESLQVATDSKTWIQQYQRNFAVELLAPSEIVREMLDGDFADENKEKVATYFKVSPFAIDAMIKNNQRDWYKEAV